MVGDSDKNFAPSDKEAWSDPAHSFIMTTDGLELGRCRRGEPAMEILIHTAEQACVLVTLTFILAQTGSFTHKRRQIGPREQVAAILLFLVMAFTEEFIAQQHTPMSARTIASCATGAHSPDRRQARPSAWARP